MYRKATLFGQGDPLGGPQGYPGERPVGAATSTGAARSMALRGRRRGEVDGAAKSMVRRGRWRGEVESVGIGRNRQESVGIYRNSLRPSGSGTSFNLRADPPTHAS